MSQFPLYLYEQKNSLSKQANDSFENDLSGAKNKRMTVSKMTYRVRKVFGRFEKQTPVPYSSGQTLLIIDAISKDGIEAAR